MAVEIEAKFLNIDHDVMRATLAAAGAILVQPMHLMHRQMFDYTDGRLQANHSRLRVRDENGKITLTFKKGRDNDYADESETTVGSYEIAAEILEAIGLHVYSSQQTKREIWHLDDVEVMLDVWPWLDPYIEIEGPTEDGIKAAAQKLGLDWLAAGFGSVDTAYRAQYPRMMSNESIGAIADLSFDGLMPQWFSDRI